MKNKLALYSIFAVISILLSTLIITSNSLSNVTACVKSPGCINLDKQPRGKLTIRYYGFPSTYKQTATFYPQNGDERRANYAGYAETRSITKAMSIPNIVINIVFWFALLHTLYSLVVKVLPKKSVDRFHDRNIEQSVK